MKAKTVVPVIINGKQYIEAECYLNLYNELVNTVGMLEAYVSFHNEVVDVIKEEERRIVAATLKLMESINNRSDDKLKGYIYIIENHNQTCKVGWTFNVDQRFKAYKNNIKELFVFDLLVDQSVERKFHSNNKSIAINKKGEWYKMSLNEMKKIVLNHINKFSEKSVSK